MSFLFVSDLARRFGVKPRVISDLFYDRVLDDVACPVVAGRRIIPNEYAAAVEAALRDRNLLPEPEAAAI